MITSTQPNTQLEFFNPEELCDNLQTDTHSVMPWIALDIVLLLGYISIQLIA